MALDKIDLWEKFTCGRPDYSVEDLYLTSKFWDFGGYIDVKIKFKDVLHG